MKEIVLTDDSLLLRPLKLTDSQAVFEAVRESIREISPWMPWCPEDYAFDDSEKWIEIRPKAWSDGTEYDFAIINQRNDTLLGACGLNKIDNDNRIANLGYWVRSSKTGKGIASSAVRLLARFAFEELKLNRVEITPAIGNKASQRVAMKAGATKEGILRNGIVVRDKIYDVIMYSLIPEDLKYY
jgi:RimJ/RimL family protein N-acetyltransferase